MQDGYFVSSPKGEQEDSLVPVTLWVREGREERNHSTETIIQLCESSTCTLCVWDLQHDIKAGCQKKSPHKPHVAHRVRSDRETERQTN